ncbi:hypothetical protein ACFLSU_08570, partial [Bacteroidota bacterium]
LFMPKQNKIKTIPIVIGVLTLIAVMMALLRNEMFYLAMGSLLALYINSKNNIRINKRSTVFYLSIILVLMFKVFPDLIDNTLKTFFYTFDAFNGVESDASAEIRTDIQLPILLQIINDNLFFGAGFFATSYEVTKHHLIYDIPILGGVAAYGIVGMTLYYHRFILIFKRFLFSMMPKILKLNYPLECIVTNTLFAFFITMITFRNFHINLELAFNWGMPEIGLLIGIFYGLTKFLTNINKFKNEKINSRFR